MKNLITLKSQYWGFTFLFLLLSMLIWLGGQQAHAAISFVQTVALGASASSTATSTTSTLGISSNVSAGNSLIITMVLDQGSGSAVSCSDSKGNSYTIDLDVNDTVMRSVTCSAHNVTALTTADTVTITHPWIQGRVISVYEFFGLATNATFDASNVAGGSVFFANSGNASISQADELLIGNIGVEGPYTDGFTFGSGYTPLLPRIGNASGSPVRTLNTQYQIVSSTGAYSSTATLAIPRWWISSIATYRAAATITLSGTCQQVDQATDCFDTGTVRVAINGVLSTQTQTIVAGSWIISGITAPTSGDVITVFIDGAADNQEAVAITKYDGTGNITGIELIEEHLTIGSDDNQTLSNIDLSQYDNSASGDEDVFHDVNTANDLTVDITGALSAEELYIKSGNTYQPSGNISTRDLEINGALIADSNTINLSGSWDNHAIFTAGTSTVNFIAGFWTRTVDSNGATIADFYNVNFNDAGGTATYQLESILNVGNDFTISDGILDTKNGSSYAINVANDFLQSGGQVQARSSTLTVGRHFTANGSETSTGYNSAYLVMNGAASLTYNNLGNYWDNGLFNITLGQSGNTTTLINTMTVRNQIVVGSGTLGGTTSLYLRGVPNPLVVDANANIEINQLRFFGNTQQNLPTLINGYDASITLARNGTILTQTGAVTINAGSHLRLNGDTFASRSVTYNTNGFALIVGGNIQVGAGGDTGLKTLNGTNSNITVGGDFEIRTGTTAFTESNSTVNLNGTAAQTVLSSGESFNNLIVTNASSAGITFNDGFTVNDLSNTTANSVMNFKGGATYTINGTLNLSGQATGSKIKLRSTDSPLQWQLNISSGASKSIDYVDVQDSDASGSDNSQKAINPTNSVDSDNNIDWFAYPKAYYQLDETVWGSVIDSSGFNQHGSIIGSVSPSDTNPAAAGSPGSCGYADIDANTSLLSFDAIDTGVNITSDIGNTGTINFWYNSNTNWQGGADRQLLDAATAAGNVFYLTLKSTGQLYFGTTDNASTSLDLAGNVQNFTANTWVHIAVSWDLPNNQLQIFINGALDKTDSSYSSNGVISNLNSLYIGDNRSSYQNGNMTPNSANGAIDELRIYDAVLSISKIQSDQAATHPCNPTLPAPIAEWRLNELSWGGTVNEVVDSGVNALHGARQGGATPTTAKSCNGATLNGSSDFLEIADNNLLDINDKLTVMGWFKADSLPGSGQLKSIVVKNLNYELNLDENGNIYWWWNNASDTSRSLTSSGVTITPGNWYHVALVYDNSGSQKIYIDGIERNSDTLFENLKTTASTLKIGATAGSTGRYFDGQIDEVRVYNAALSASQVNVAMNQTYTCEPGIIAYYNMDEALFGSIADSSGNGNNASVVSGVVARNNAPAIPGGTCGYAEVPANTSPTIFDAVDTTVDINDDVGNTGTISFWYKSNTQWNDASGADRQLLDASRTNKYFYLSLDTFGILHFGLEDSSDFDIRLAGNPQNFVANTWVHLAITWDLSNDVLQIYINGSLDVSQQYASSGILGQLDTLYLGDNRSNYFTTYMTANSANGTMDEVRIYNNVLSANDVINDRDSTHPCPQYLDHFVVGHDGQGINCAGENVSVNAKFIDGSTYTSYLGSITLDTQSGNGTWTLTSGAGNFNDVTPDDGIATYTYDIADNGVATFSLSYLSGTASIDIDAYEGSIRDDDSESNLVFSASGFTVTGMALNNPPSLPIDLSIANQVAASSFSLHLAAYGSTANDSTCGIIEGYNGVKNLNFWSNYSNPTSGTVMVTVEGNNIATNEATSAAQNVTFTQGQAEVTVNYTDVGAILIEMKDVSNSDPNLSGGIKGGSSTFIVKPAGFVLSNIVRTSDSFANPAASNASGTMFMGAGEKFSVTVSAINSAGDTTPNYGQETSPEAIKLTPMLMAPSGGAAGTFAADTGFTGFSNGIDSGNFSWSEVGIITLTPSIFDGDYLGTGDITGTTSADIGRFYPNHFQTTFSNGSFANTCASSTPFTYLGQSFAYLSSPTVTATAKNLAGATTLNYNNAFAKLTTGGVSLSYPGADNIQTDEGGSTLLTLISTSGTPDRTDNGDGSLTFALGANSPDNFAYQRSAGQVDPFMPNLSIQLTSVTDSDGASANDLTSPKDIKPAGNLQRFGRAYAQDSYGALDPLTLDIGIQYYSGSGLWLQNIDDSCSAFSYTRMDNGITISTSPSSPTAINSGVGNVTLSITGDAGDPGGSSQITTSWDSWLRYNLDDNDQLSDGDLYDDNPSATATFGIFRGDDRYLDWRETL